MKVAKFADLPRDANALAQPCVRCCPSVIIGAMLGQRARSIAAHFLITMVGGDEDVGLAPVLPVSNRLGVREDGMMVDDLRRGRALVCGRTHVEEVPRPAIFRYLCKTLEHKTPQAQHTMHDNKNCTAGAPEGRAVRDHPVITLRDNVAR